MFASDMRVVRRRGDRASRRVLPAIVFALAITGGTVAQATRAAPLEDSHALQRQREPTRRDAVAFELRRRDAAQRGTLVPDDDPVLRRLRRIDAELIAAAPRTAHQSLDWRWELNLFRDRTTPPLCLLGGKLMLARSLPRALRATDDELAALLAHAMAHALLGHEGSMPGRTRYAPGLRSRYTVGEERAADRTAIELAARAGYDPRAAIALKHRLESLAQPAARAWSAMHRDYAGRADVILAAVRTALPLFARARGVLPGRLPPYVSNFGERVD
ncbi:MAG: hypothetical protein H6934_12620 [Burkholderiaceae bacterium]|nr:hypothetical protein [Burkholderiaceae bacterium]